MPGLRLGPLLRYVDEDTATVWVETDGPCEAEVRCGDGRGAGGSARTWQVAGHHYALITVVGLEPGTETPYSVLLDGREVWPHDGAGLPPSVIRTRQPDGAGAVRLAFGSCRWAAPPAGPFHDPVGPDALGALARRAAGGGEVPDALLLLGDQVYADETSPAVRERLGRRRSLKEPPWNQVADYEEYTDLYYESWLAPEVRWLLSTVPSMMIFDDHDVIDDWNTSAAWQRDMRATGWWRERILGGLTSYWVYQHLGNLSPGELAEDPVFAAVREAGDGTAVLRDFAARADADPRAVRWSFRRDFGRVRLVMVDTRAARVLEEDRRAMVDEDEMAWLRKQVLAGDCDHLLIGSSLPWLLPPAVHDAEGWNAALCAGSRGPRWARWGEKVRRAADLEHWAAFPRSFDELTELIDEAARAEAAPATVCVLSGDVHHAYVAEPAGPEHAAPETPRQGPATPASGTAAPGGGGPAGDDAPPVPVTGSASTPAPRSRVLQLTCSPMHNSIPAVMRAGFRFSWSGAARRLGRVLARHGRTRRPAPAWECTGGPWFGNHLMTLTLRGRSALLSMDMAQAVRRGGRARPELARVLDRELSATGESP
ncbi:alkaline phosphatase D family protein [Streptomyces sp. JJ36]|uniref:alkaline phosphatase D family protein n=1 Tax=Streptomyces sp. JJ36 TaxID=2736645 RepID=UPI001F34EC57|nr:alkaline phosphatase D family protein [Streptomyces sp. JJ36]MCF6521817.1 alkaline phosphatase family protein [Streptomyces sp. JJ36]